MPLGQIAKIQVSEGPSNIYREDGQRYTPVKFSVRGRDLESTIAEARMKIAAAVHLPYDSHLDWAGEINQLKEAEDRLKMILPVTLLLIGFLVYSATKNWVDSLIVFFNIPVATRAGCSRCSSRGSTSRCRRRWASSPSSASPCRTRSSS